MVEAFSNFHTESGLKSVSDYLSGKTYVSGDHFLGKAVGVRFGSQAATATTAPAKEAAKPSNDNDDDDYIDLFGEETKEAKKAVEASEAAEAFTKNEESGKSPVFKEVKPWDDETGMNKLEEDVCSFDVEGLLWGACKLVLVGHGKQIMLTIIDKLISGYPTQHLKPIAWSLSYLTPTINDIRHAFSNFHTESGLKYVNDHLFEKTCISRGQLTKNDIKVYGEILEQPSSDIYPNASKWYHAVSAKLASSFPRKAFGVRFGSQTAPSIAAPAKEASKPPDDNDDDDDINHFGEETKEEKKAAKARKAAKASTKKKNKSSTIDDRWDVDRNDRPEKKSEYMLADRCKDCLRRNMRPFLELGLYLQKSFTAHQLVGLMGYLSGNILKTMLLQIECKHLLVVSLDFAAISSKLNGMNLRCFVFFPYQWKKNWRPGNTSARSEDPLNKHVSHIEFRAAFTTLSHFVAAQNERPASVQANPVANTAAVRIWNLTRMNPPLFSGSKSKEDPQEFLDMVQKEVYWWSGMKKDIAEFVAKFSICQQVKIEHQKPSGSIQEFSISTLKWEEVNIDFVMGSPYVRRKDLEFDIGDYVYLKISPMKGVKRFGKKGKLSSRCVGPYRILNHLKKKVAYELYLPADLASVNLVFYVFLLKKCIGDPTVLIPIESVDIQNSLFYEEVLVEILDRQISILRNKEVSLVKVLWRN
ncbi:Elongation factor 1-beta 1 [Capsicum chinense]|nr:Elongation factor 1-beta 1 [Capsicum chinense]